VVSFLSCVSNVCLVEHHWVKPGAGPSTEPKIGNNGPAAKKNEGDRGAVKTVGANKSNTAGISKARVNVIRTMLFISVCFVVCLMPYDTYFFVRVVTVFIHLFTLFFILPIVTLQYNVIASDDPKVAASRRPHFIFV